MQSLEAYMTQRQLEEDAEKEKWNEYVDKIKSASSKANIGQNIANVVNYMNSVNPYAKAPMVEVAEPSKSDVTLAGYTRPKEDSLTGRLLLEQIKQSKSGEKKAEGNLVRFTEQYRKDKQTQSLQDKYNSMSSLGTIVFSELLSNPSAVSMAKRMMVRASGDPRPSDKDVESFGNIPSLKNKVQALADKLSEGQLLTAEDKDAWKELVTIQQRKLDDEFIKHNDNWAKTGILSYGLQPDMAKEVVTAASVSKAAEDKAVSEDINAKILEKLNSMVIK